MAKHFIPTEKECPFTHYTDRQQNGTVVIVNKDCGTWCPLCQCLFTDGKE